MEYPLYFHLYLFSLFGDTMKIDRNYISALEQTSMFFGNYLLGISLVDVGWTGNMIPQSPIVYIAVSLK